MAAPGMDLNIDQFPWLPGLPGDRPESGGKNESLNLGSKQTWAIGLPGLSPDHSRQPKDFQPDPHPLKGRTFPLRRGREDVPSGNQSRACRQAGVSAGQSSLS